MDGDEVLTNRKETKDIQRQETGQRHQGGRMPGAPVDNRRLGVARK